MSYVPNIGLMETGSTLTLLRLFTYFVTTYNFIWINSKCHLKFVLSRQHHWIIVIVVVVTIISNLTKIPVLFINANFGTVVRLASIVYEKSITSRECTRKLEHILTVGHFAYFVWIIDIPNLTWNAANSVVDSTRISVTGAMHPTDRTNNCSV